MYSDPEFDRQLEELIVTTDEAEETRIVQEMTLRYLSATNCVMFPTAWRYSFWWPWLKNYNGEPGLGVQNPGGLMARVWVDQELKKEMGY